MVGIHWRLPRLGRLRSFRVENIAVRCADVMALFECRWWLGGGRWVGGRSLF
jgi:hypothetical protein